MMMMTMMTTTKPTEMTAKRSRLIWLRVDQQKTNSNSTEMSRLWRTSRRIQGARKPHAFLGRAQGKAARWVRGIRAGTGFLMKPTTFWTSCWTWTLPPGSQLLRPCSTPCSQTCETSRPEMLDFGLDWMQQTHPTINQLREFCQKEPVYFLLSDCILFYIIIRRAV